MPQEFLASFAVDIDESGVNRLQLILDQNRELAEKVAAAFDKARQSMTDFLGAVTEDMPGLPDLPLLPTVEPSVGGFAFPLNLDFTQASRQLETFLAGARKQLRLSADGSGIVSAASRALSQVQSLFDGTELKLKVSPETDDSPGDAMAEGLLSGLRLSSGGRFTSRTRAEIAEDGGTEYVIPVNREERAVPLLRSLLAELSASARASLQDALQQGGGWEQGDGSARSATAELLGRPRRSDLSRSLALADLPDLMSGSAAAAAPSISQQTTNNNNIQAPVNIRVESVAADPEAVGRSIYNTAEHYLLRTLGGVTG